MDNLNREQAALLCELQPAFDKDTLSVRKCRVTKMTKRTPTEAELGMLTTRSSRELFANYFHIVDDNYTPRLNDGKQIAANKQALLKLGCTQAQATEFASREFKALPKWLRDRIKRVEKTKQAEPVKLRPAAGELAFYINPHRFPPMQKPVHVN